MLNYKQKLLIWRNNEFKQGQAEEVGQMVGNKAKYQHTISDMKYLSHETWQVIMKIIH
jgi:hypothetical protein